MLSIQCIVIYIITRQYDMRYFKIYVKKSKKKQWVGLLKAYLKKIKDKWNI